MRVPTSLLPQQAPGRIRGFTIVELMVVVSIVAILASVAAPSFMQMIATQRIRSVASALKESLWVARAEATKRNASVSFTFVNAATDWDIMDASGATPMLKQHGHPAVVSKTSSGNNVQFNFNAYGRLSTGSGWIELSDASGSTYRCINVATTGRTTTTNAKCT